MSDERRKPRNVSMSYHMVMNLNTALDMAYCKAEWNYDGKNGLERIKLILDLPEDMKQMDIINELQDMKKRGYEVVPGCDDPLPNGRCPGHVRRGLTARAVHV